MSAPNEYGYLQKCNWVLIRRAPLTASGLNEVLAMAETKDKLNLVAKVLGYPLGRRSQYKMVRWADIVEYHQKDEEATSEPA